MPEATMRKTTTAFTGGDAANELLRSFRIESSVLCRSVMAAPWGFGVTSREMGSFHVVIRGAGSLEVEGVDESFPMRTGDLIVFPRGDAHWVRDSESTAAPSLESILAHHDVVDGELRFGGDDGPSSEIVCGVFRLENGASSAWMTRLPSVIRASTLARGHEWRPAVIDALRREARAPTTGGAAVVNRLLESLLADALRTELIRPGLTTPAGAVIDRRVGEVLARIHQSPEAPWNVAGLARIASMSRSAFSSRFHSLVGTAPMRYVTELRLETAHRLLRSTDSTVAEVAKRVGYASDSALSRAFTSHFGHTPGFVRRERGGSEAFHGPNT
jgi:AraC-like DNA-binding protein/mannose-6-phosphate isomerase-like protein (cupin superfamily)